MRALLLVFLLSACAAPISAPRTASPGAGVTPRAVVLYRDTVTARMSDGAFCTAVRPGRAGPWRAQLSGCPHRWPASVLRTPSQPRVPLSPALGDPFVILSSPQGDLGFAPGN